MLAMGCWLAAPEPAPGLLMASATVAIPAIVSICTQHSKNAVSCTYPSNRVSIVDLSVLANGPKAQS